MSSQNPRQIASEVLRQQCPGGDFVETRLERALVPAGLSSADRALCQELVYGVVRWQAALDWLIGRKTDRRKQRPMLQNLLRLGLYQVFWLDRIPAHAAVHETVELTRQNGLGAQAGFVNAVLRGYLRDADATRKLLAELKASRPAIGWSHPEWLVARWQKRWGAEKTSLLLEWNNLPPKMFVRVNALKFPRDELPESRTSNKPSGTRIARPSEAEGFSRLLAQWRDEGVTFDPVRRDWFQENLVFELKSHPPLAKLSSFLQGYFYVQDSSTLLAVTQLNPRPGETILDFCAAPGGKTTFIAQLMNDQGRIVAQDVSEERLKLIRDNCARLGISCVETISHSQLALRDSRFDRVLVDVPCSNTGVMRRRVDLRWRIEPREISRLRRTQSDLLEQAAPRLKPGGVLVYSTCSLEPEENHEVVQRFLRTHHEFNLEFERELLPFVDGTDGASVAQLRRLP